MTKKEAKAAALRWLDEAAAGGRALEVRSAADLEDRMDHLLGAAVAAVCARFPRRAVYTVTDAWPERSPAKDAAYVRITLPGEMTALTGVRYCAPDGRLMPFSDYRRVSQGVYIIPARLNGALVFSCIRRPVLPEAAAPEDEPLDVDETAAVLVPLRLAADMLTGVDETAVLSGYLAARYSELAAAVYRTPEPDPAAVECVYDW